MHERTRITTGSARRYFCTILLAVFVSGCGLVGEFSRLNTTLERVTSEPDSVSYKLGAGLSSGLIDSLSSPESQRKLNETVNALITELLKTAENESPNVIDALLGEKFQTRLKEIWAINDSQLIAIKDGLLGSRTRAQLVALRNAVLDEELMRRVAALRDTLVGPPFQHHVAALRDTLLGTSTNNAIAAIIDSAVLRLAERYESDLQPLLQDDLGFFKKNAEGLLITIALLTAGIIGFVWWQKRKYQRLVTLLTTQIDRLDTDAYVELTRNIRAEAQKSGDEEHLRKELARQDLLGEEAYKRNKKEHTR